MLVVIFIRGRSLKVGEEEEEEAENFERPPSLGFKIVVLQCDRN